jgi:hypothetical protein
MNSQDVIQLLRKSEIPYLKTTIFSQLPGIYALFYIGDNFPFVGCNVSTHQIIYIGKTESSQEKRDAKTHFTSGKTGSSTVRKSIGSILCKLEKLNQSQEMTAIIKMGDLAISCLMKSANKSLQIG